MGEQSDVIHLPDTGGFQPNSGSFYRRRGKVCVRRVIVQWSPLTPIEECSGWLCGQWIEYRRTVDRQATAWEIWTYYASR